MQPHLLCYLRRSTITRKDITVKNQFREIEEKNRLNLPIENQVCFLMAIIDTIEIISEQVFEQLKYLHMLFRKKLKSILAHGIEDMNDIFLLMLS